MEYKHLLAVGLTFGSSSQTDNPQAPSPLAEAPIGSPDAAASTLSLAKQYGIEVELILAMVKTESNFNPNAISGSGAVGLTQLMPPTAQDLGLKVPSYRNPRKPTPDSHTDERFHPHKNLAAGVRYLSLMLAKYDGNYVLALAAYNAGPGNVQKNVPLIRETERHVGKVLNYFYQYKADAALRDADLHKLDALLGKTR